MSPTTLSTLSSFIIASAAIGAPHYLVAPWKGFNTGDFPKFAPRYAAAADLDGDGHLDLVVSRHHFSGAGLSILMGHGDGTFGAPLVYSMPSNDSLGEVRLTDFDGDGDHDAIAVVSGAFDTGTRVAVYPGNGNGTFGVREEFTVGSGPQSLVIADMNGDGFADVVTANLSGDNVSVLRHNGLTGAPAAFLTVTNYTCGDNANRIAAGDIDGDGDIDVAVGRTGFTGGSGLTVMLNNGTGALSVSQNLTQVPGAAAQGAPVLLHDMDLDGDLDLVCTGANNATFGQSVVAIRKNDGAGTFAAPILYTSPDGPYTPWDMQAGDLNADGWPDLVYSTPSGRVWDGICAALSDGKGGWMPTAFYKSSKWTRGVTMADFDEDGDIDVAAVAEDGNMVCIHENVAFGNLASVPIYGTGGSFTNDIGHGDVNGDGHLDAMAWDTRPRLLLGNGDGSFQSSLQYVGPTGLTDCRLREMDGDGLPDLLMLTSSTVWIARSLGNGTFSAYFSFGHDACAPVTCEAADLDGDGDLDLVIPDRTQCVPGMRRINLYRNDGAGAAFTTMPPVLLSSDFATGIIPGDFNGDGILDILTTFNSTSAGISVLLGLGGFAFLDPFPTGVVPYDYAAGDVNGDGHLDVVYLLPQPSFGTAEVGHMLGYGDGFFQFPVDQNGPSGLEGAFLISSDVKCADVNGDGLDDLLVTSNAPNDITVFHGQAGGTLAPEDRYGCAAYSPRRTTVADFTGDGRLDVVTQVSLPPSGFSDGLMLLRGTVPTPPSIYGDITGDGVVDFADLLELLAQWGACAPPCPLGCEADLNGDCAVDFTDLLELLAFWS